MKPNKSNQAKKKDNPSTTSSKVFKVIPSESFISAAKALKEKYPNIGDDFYSLHLKLKADPITGNKSLGNGLYKIRMKITDKKKGERSGARVIVDVQVEDGYVIVVYCYDKSELSNVDDKQLEILTKRARQIVIEKYYKED